MSGTFPTGRGAPTRGRAPTQAKLIFVVDDDPWIQQVLRLSLEDEGYYVVVASSGEEALEQLAQCRPSLIVLDWMMPRMNGPEFARELNRRGLRPDIPVLLLTAAGGPTAKAAMIGADACLAKPFDLTELLNEVAHLVAD